MVKKQQHISKPKQKNQQKQQNQTLTKKNNIVSLVQRSVAFEKEIEYHSLQAGNQAIESGRIN